MKLALSVCLLLAPASLVHARPLDHLLRGARAFQSGNFEDALAAFKQAEGEGAKEAIWYRAASLAKLKRTEEALEVFYEAENVASDARDELIDYHFAIAAYDARLYHAAQELLLRVQKTAGPKIAAQTRQVLGELEKFFAAEAPPTAIEGYLANSRAAEQRGFVRLARAYRDEAEKLSHSRRGLHPFLEAADDSRRDGSRP